MRFLSFLFTVGFLWIGLKIWCCVRNRPFAMEDDVVMEERELLVEESIMELSREEAPSSVKAPNMNDDLPADDDVLAILLGMF
jgi:hypothetical protein